MSYAPNTADYFRRAATYAYVDKVLKGAKSADLPVMAQASSYTPRCLHEDGEFVKKAA